jgi:hypothetical protein
MWSGDMGRKQIPDYQFVAYPPPGFASSTYFGRKPSLDSGDPSGPVWSFSPHPTKYKLADPKTVGVKVYRKTDATPDKPGTELKLVHLKVDSSGIGDKHCVIFRPQPVTLDEGARYVVEITGFKDAKGAAVTFNYMVIFAATLP